MKLISSKRWKGAKGMNSVRVFGRYPGPETPCLFNEPMGVVAQIGLSVSAKIVAVCAKFFPLQAAANAHTLHPDSLHEPERRAGCPQRGEAATKTERAHPGRSGAEVSRVGLSQSLSLVARCGQDGRAPKNRRGSRRFRQILIQPDGKVAKPPALPRRGEYTAPYLCRTVQGFKARIGWGNSYPGRLPVEGRRKSHRVAHYRCHRTI